MLNQARQSVFQGDPGAGACFGIDQTVQEAQHGITPVLRFDFHTAAVGENLPSDSVTVGLRGPGE
jgi:hypothetical protein